VDAVGADQQISFRFARRPAGRIDEAGEDLVAAWQQAYDAYERDHPDLAAEFHRRVVVRRPPDGWDRGLKTYPVGEEIATRNASNDAIQALAATLPAMFGGSADLSESNLTDIKGGGDF